MNGWMDALSSCNLFSAVSPKPDALLLESRAKRSCLASVTRFPFTAASFRLDGRVPLTLSEPGSLNVHVLPTLSAPVQLAGATARPWATGCGQKCVLLGRSPPKPVCGPVLCRSRGTLLRDEATTGSQIPSHHLEENRPEEPLDMLDFV